MKRLISISILAGLTWLGMPAAPVQPAAADQELPSPPNILIIVTDDQRVDSMEAMPETVELFEEGGTSYTEAFATTPLCCPSRASILTGLYAHNHNVKIQSRAGSTIDVGLTLQRFLSQRDYYTGFIGKWLNGWDLDVTPPYLHESAFFNSSGVAYDDASWNVDGKVEVVDGYSTNFMAKRARGFLNRTEADDRRPWFLVMTPPQPHSPFTPEKKFSNDRFGRWQGNPAVGEEDKSDKPPWIESRKAGFFQGRRVRTKQLRSLRSVDELVASTFRTLRRNGEVRDTLAIYTSDNGYLWAEHGISDIKRYPYTPSVKIPLYVKWPNHVAAGLTDARLAANIDIAPTVLEAAGDLERVSELDGRSLLQPSTRQRLLLEYWKGEGLLLNTWASIRQHNYQYVEYYDDNGTVIYREYYDLVADPFQLENLLGNDDPLDDPVWLPLSSDLQRLRECSAETCP